MAGRQPGDRTRRPAHRLPVTDANGRFALDGRVFQVDRNDGPHHLHGGSLGFHKRCWRGRALDRGVQFSLCSEDGDQGYPGRLEAIATYLVDGSRVLIELTATCDAPTVVNLTSHAYFNLAGSGDITNHELRVPANAYLPTDDTLIPTGEIVKVAETRFDANSWSQIHPFSGRAGYLDMCYVDSGTGHRVVAELRELKSGRCLSISSTQPAVQVYMGQQLDGTLLDRMGQKIGPLAGICLEPQGWPDAPNQSGFPSAVLRPGDTYRHLIEWRFESA